MDIFEIKKMKLYLRKLVFHFITRCKNIFNDHRGYIFITKNLTKESIELIFVSITDL